ncbi:hypothetical protein [Streptomyces sp. NPDC003077]|uniref:hypothetical protein n=1 Tax=Streptomyces sp. NPDC003077 TaxID=3154443 RepID=UPI0033A9E818
MRSDPIRITRDALGAVEVGGPVDAFAAGLLARAGFETHPMLGGVWIRLPFDMGEAWENEHAGWAATMLTAARYPVDLDPDLRGGPATTSPPASAPRRAPDATAMWPAPPNQPTARTPLNATGEAIPHPTTPELPVLIDRLRDYRLRFSVIHLRCETALNQLRDRHRNIVGSDGLSAAQAARDERNRVAELFRNTVLPHADTLLDAARSAIETMPPAPHHAAWRLLLEDLAHATNEIRSVLAAAPSPTGQEQLKARDMGLWPYVRAWAEHSSIVSDLAEQHRAPAAPLSADEQREWNDRAQAAWHRGELDASQRWHDAEGRMITLAYLLEGDESIILVLAGELGTPQMQVLGHYDTEYEAGQSSPPQVPAGVLRPDVHPFAPRSSESEVSLKDLTRHVVAAQHSADVADALLIAVESEGSERGPLPRLGELISTAAEFAQALDTQRGWRSAARLGALAQQLDVLSREVRAAAEELEAAIDVLPPHRTPHPLFLPPAPRSAPSATPPPCLPGRPYSGSALRR